MEPGRTGYPDRHRAPGRVGHPRQPAAVLVQARRISLTLYAGLAATGAALVILVASVALSPTEAPPPDTGGEPAATAGSAGAPSDSGATPGPTHEPPEMGSDPPTHAEDLSRPSGEGALRANPLYETGRMAPRPCPVPALDVEDPDSVEEFLHVLTDCLDEAWTTQFERAGVPFDPPQRVYWTEPGNSPCRDYPSEAGAFYCRASTGIYIGTRDVVEKWQEEENGIVYASLLAHEYGHHVQGEAGLLDYYHERRGQESDTAARNLWTRRSELQANCLAGVFLGSIAVSYPVTDGDLDLMHEDARATADRSDDVSERTHGTPDNSVLWLEHGFEEQRPGACNTWEADSDLVE